MQKKKKEYNKKYTLKRLQFLYLIPDSGILHTVRYMYTGDTISIVHFWPRFGVRQTTFGIRHSAFGIDSFVQPTHTNKHKFRFHLVSSTLQIDQSQLLVLCRPKVFCVKYLFKRMKLPTNLEILYTFCDLHSCRRDGSAPIRTLSRRPPHRVKTASQLRHCNGTTRPTSTCLRWATPRPASIWAPWTMAILLAAQVVSPTHRRLAAVATHRVTCASIIHVTVRTREPGE